MNQDEAFEEIETKETFLQKYLGLSLKKFIILVSSIVILAFYVGDLLYGSNSLKVLLNLQDYQIYLKTEIVRLKKENASLQKEYFELKEISAK
jgi:hypothetical protein